MVLQLLSLKPRFLTLISVMIKGMQSGYLSLFIVMCLIAPLDLPRLTHLGGGFIVESLLNT